MLQGSRILTGRRDVLGELRVQLSRLLALALVAEVAITRGGLAAHGLRLVQEHGVLRRLSSLADQIGPTLSESLHLAAILLCGSYAPGPWRGRRPTEVATLGLVLLAAGWSLLWRLALPPSPPFPPPALAVLVLGTGTAAIVKSRPCLLAVLLGGLLCSLWQAAAGLGLRPEALTLTEQAGEILLLFGVLLAGCAPGAPRGRTSRGSLAAGLTAGLVLGGLLWGFHTPARHLASHLFGLDQAGVPFWVTGALLAAAGGALVAMTLGGRARRRLALGLALLLCSARGPEPELVALRSTAVLLLIVGTEPLPRCSRPDGPGSGRPASADPPP